MQGGDLRGWLTPWWVDCLERVGREEERSKLERSGQPYAVVVIGGAKFSYQI